MAYAIWGDIWEDIWGDIWAIEVATEVDTDNEKLAIMEWCSVWEPGLPMSPGAFGQDDQQQLLNDYPGVLWAGGGGGGAGTGDGITDITNLTGLT